MPAENKTGAAGAPTASPGAASANEKSPDDAANDANGDARAEQPEPAADEDDLAALSPEELIEKLQQAQAENTEARDGLLRARAEVENIRRRSQNEINAARKFAIESFAKELLGVRDSLDRAAAVTLDSDAAEPVAQMKKGLGLTLEQFDSALARFAVVEVAAAPGAPFDPECHQAISTAASDEIAPDHIISVVQKGFLLKERLLRPAMVVVAKA
ncbi:MAG: Protein GrpE [Arenicellales bacterium IbO2]|nr:MAG: Protein GrpE [Arenicellales bacterium IbO2]